MSAISGNHTNIFHGISLAQNSVKHRGSGMQEIQIKSVSEGTPSRRVRNRGASRVQGDQALMFLSFFPGAGRMHASTKARPAAGKDSGLGGLPVSGARSGVNPGRKIPAAKAHAGTGTEALPGPVPHAGMKNGPAAEIKGKEDGFRTAAASLRNSAEAKGEPARIQTQKDQGESGKFRLETAKQGDKAVAEGGRKHAGADLRPENANTAAAPSERSAERSDIFGQALKATTGTEKGRNGRKETPAGADSPPAGSSTERADSERPAAVMMQEKTAAKTAFLRTEQGNPAARSAGGDRERPAVETAEKRTEDVRGPAIPRKTENAQQFVDAMRRKEIETASADREPVVGRTARIDSARSDLPQSLKAEAAGRPAEAKAAVKPEPVISQVTVGVQAALDRGVSRIRLELQPPNLGNLDLDLIVNRDKVKMIILADNQEVREVLRSNAEQLRASLEGQGLRMDSLDVFVQDRSAGDRSGGFREFALSRDGSGNG
jgi:flagellar hook-length control protein FliK